MALRMENEEKIVNQYLIPFFASAPREAQDQLIEQFFTRIAGDPTPFSTAEDARLFSFYKNPHLPFESPAVVQTFIREYLFDQSYPTALNPLHFRAGKTIFSKPPHTAHFFSHGEKPLYYALAAPDLQVENLTIPQTRELKVFKSLYQALEAARVYKPTPGIWLVAAHSSTDKWQWETQTLGDKAHLQAVVTCATAQSTSLIPLIGGLVEFGKPHQYTLLKTVLNQGPEKTTRRCSLI